MLEPLEMVEATAVCPYCEDPIDYCMGHGEIGDPAGYEALRLHYEGTIGAVPLGNLVV